MPPRKQSNTFKEKTSSNQAKRTSSPVSSSTINKYNFSNAGRKPKAATNQAQKNQTEQSSSASFRRKRSNSSSTANNHNTNNHNTNNHNTNNQTKSNSPRRRSPVGTEAQRKLAEKLDTLSGLDQQIYNVKHPLEIAGIISPNRLNNFQRVITYVILQHNNTCDENIIMNFINEHIPVLNINRKDPIKEFSDKRLLHIHMSIKYDGHNIFQPNPYREKHYMCCYPKTSSHELKPNVLTPVYENKIFDLVKKHTDGISIENLVKEAGDIIYERGPFMECPPLQRIRSILIVLKNQQKIENTESNTWTVKRKMKVPKILLPDIEKKIISSI